jgi:hypothetical protein
MKNSAELRPSECVRLLADRRRMPDARAYKADETVLALVQGFSRHFADIAKDRHSPADPFWYRMDRVKNSMESKREQCAVACLADTNATAALVKEIAFTDVPLNEDGSFESVDLGAGTGILSVGAAIAGLRAGASRILLHLVDEEKGILDLANRTVGCIGNHVEHEIHADDIIEPFVYTARFDPERVRFWISETISQGTPPMQIVHDRVIWLEPGTHRSDLDPFPHVVHQLTSTVTDFPELIREGRAVMFPDIINDRYRPGHHAALQLLSSKSHAQHGPLESVGKDFFRLNHDQSAASRW